ncbi:MAG: hypothetical protein HKN23_07195 [Verrucomicrobiales bacterium]|nr:hypothetical protein [Verrucomicrobiales bacterium]
MANFFDETLVSPLSRCELDELSAVAHSFTDDEGREVVQLDDMIFVVDELSTRGFSGRKWTNGKLYYAFSSNVDQTNRTRFRAACAEWSNVADLEFIERTNQQNYVYVKSASTNSSYCGMIGGPQRMNIYNWRWKFIIAHELGHALGLAHEQCRNDRDSFVEINEANIIDGKEHNFDIRNTRTYSAYDFASIMHYGRKAFSKNNLPTIEGRPGYEDQEPYMGNRRYMTALDAAGMASHYGAP